MVSIILLLGCCDIEGGGGGPIYVLFSIGVDYYLTALVMVSMVTKPI
jgi:hypothetical protein